MTNEELILTIDNGTQSVKALLFSLDGNLIARMQVAFEPYFSEQPGWAEQDPEVFWISICKACRKLLSSRPQLKKRIIGVSLTTQRATVINLRQHCVRLAELRPSPNDSWTSCLRPAQFVLSRSPAEGDTTSPRWPTGQAHGTWIQQEVPKP